MTDFKNFLNDFSHLISGMSSVAGGVKSEIDNNIYSVFNHLALQSGFVRRDEFDTLSERFEVAVQELKTLQDELSLLKKTSL
jgi:BMFP domain-containing protein YqiC